MGSRRADHRLEDVVAAHRVEGNLVDEKLGTGERRQGLFDVMKPLLAETEHQFAARAASGKPEPAHSLSQGVDLGLGIDRGRSWGQGASGRAWCGHRLGEGLLDLVEDHNQGLAQFLLVRPPARRDVGLGAGTEGVAQSAQQPAFKITALVHNAVVGLEPGHEPGVQYRRLADPGRAVVEDDRWTILSDDRIVHRADGSAAAEENTGIITPEPLELPDWCLGYWDVVRQRRQTKERIVLEEAPAQRFSSQARPQQPGQAAGQLVHIPALQPGIAQQAAPRDLVRGLDECRGRGEGLRDRLPRT